MVLRSQVEWALHCCALLAALPEGSFLATKDLAEFHGVPKEYLSKAMQGLSQAGIVETTLGPRGGYRLRKSPEKITFLEIVEAIEGKRSTFQCTEIRRNNPCLGSKKRDASVCAVARVMYEADEAWRDRLRATSLADLLTVLSKEIPKEVLARAAQWIGERV